MGKYTTLGKHLLKSSQVALFGTKILEKCYSSKYARKQ